MYSRISNKALTLLIITVLFNSIFMACAGKRFINAYEPLLGTWRTEKGIIITVQMSAGEGAEASIKLAPGFGGEDVEIGKVIMSAIKPMASGGYSGIFEMQSGIEPIEVEISLLSEDMMLILSRDRRVRGNRMVWRRIKGKPDE